MTVSGDASELLATTFVFSYFGYRAYDSLAAINMNEKYEVFQYVLSRLLSQFSRDLENLLSSLALLATLWEGIKPDPGSLPLVQQVSVERTSSDPKRQRSK